MTDDKIVKIAARVTGYSEEHCRLYENIFLFARAIEEEVKAEMKEEQARFDQWVSSGNR